MIDDNEKFQGVALRQIVADAASPVLVAPFVTHGRINSFVLDRRVGVFVKHSAKRMPPWPFTFHADQISDLSELETKIPKSYVVFVCGSDGLVTLSFSELHSIAGVENARQAWVRIARPPRSMYSVWGNKAELPRKVGRGVVKISEALAS